LEHPNEVEQYLREQGERHEEIKRNHPLPPELLEEYFPGVHENQWNGANR